MTLEDNKSLVHRFWEEIWNNANLDAVEDIVSSDFLLYLPTSPEPLNGPEGLKQWATIVSSAFPDKHFSIEDVIAEGNTVVTRWSMRATHNGNFINIPPTGKQVTLSGISIFRIIDGKIVEDRAAEDTLNLLQQVGAIPPL